MSSSSRSLRRPRSRQLRRPVRCRRTIGVSTRRAVAWRSAAESVSALVVQASAGSLSNRIETTARTAATVRRLVLELGVVVVGRLQRQQRREERQQADRDRASIERGHRHAIAPQSPPGVLPERHALDGLDDFRSGVGGNVIGSRLPQRALLQLHARIEDGVRQIDQEIHRVQQHRVEQHQPIASV